MTRPGPTRLSPAEINHLLQQGVAAHRAGRLDLAAECFHAVLAGAPSNADAMQLLGLTAKAAGRLDEAGEWMRRSLTVAPGQPHVRNNLGNLLLDKGDAAGALDQYDAAVRLKADYVDAWFNRAKALNALGRKDEAVVSLDRALKVKPDHVPALINRGVTLMQMKRFDAAEASLRQAVGLAPQSARAHMNLGLALKHQNRYADAQVHYRQSLAIEPQHWESWLNLGNALTALHQADDAIAAYREALARNPMDKDTHANLSKLLWRVGRTGEVLDSYVALRQQMPHSPVARTMVAEALIQFGQFDEAEAELRELSAIAADSAPVFTAMGQLMLRRGRSDEALAAFAQAAAIAPHHLEALNGQAEAALRLMLPDIALQASAQALDIDPTDQTALAMRGLAHRLRGDTAHVDRLNDYSHFVRPLRLSPPPGYDTIQAFNTALLGALDALHRSTSLAPIDQTLRHGTQTSEHLFDRSDLPLPIRQLQHMIEEGVHRYQAELRQEAGHPFLARPGRQTLGFTGSWSSRLHDQGFHTDHIHPAGWISGVYYIEVPSVCADEGEKQGWLRFGCPPFLPGGPAVHPPARTTQPQEGMMVLFPSYFWHGTNPFRGQECRTTVAFDLAPRTP